MNLSYITFDKIKVEYLAPKLVEFVRQFEHILIKLILYFTKKKAYAFGPLLTLPTKILKSVYCDP